MIIEVAKKRSIIDSNNNNTSNYTNSINLYKYIAQKIVKKFNKILSFDEDIFKKKGIPDTSLAKEEKNAPTAIKKTVAPQQPLITTFMKK